MPEKITQQEKIVQALLDNIRTLTKERDRAYKRIGELEEQLSSKNPKVKE